MIGMLADIIIRAALILIAWAVVFLLVWLLVTTVLG